MAEETEKQERPGTEERPEEEEAAGSAPKKGPPKKIMLIAAGVFVLLVIGTVIYFVFANSSQASPEPEAEGESEAVVAEDDEQSDTGSRRSSRSSPRSRRSDGEDRPSTNIFFSEFPASVVNLGLSEKYDYVYLKYGFNLELSDNKVSTELVQKMPKLVSIVDVAMSGQQWDKIGSARGRESLAMDVVEAINAELESGEVIACYFTTFVAQ
jgi:flagellar basal body-associated protein FliL